MATVKTLAASVLILFGLSAASLVAAEEWQQVDHPMLDLVFTSLENGSADYQHVYIEPVSVWYPTEGAAARERVDMLRNWTASELGGAFDANGLEVVTAPERATMIVRVQFVDFTDTLGAAQMSHWQRRFKFNVAPGRVTMVAEFIDVRTGSTFMRIADMQDQLLPDPAADLRLALAGWSDLVATVAVLPSSEVQLAHR